MPSPPPFLPGYLVTLLLSILFLAFLTTKLHLFIPAQIPDSWTNHAFPERQTLKVYVAELPRDLNYGLVEQYLAYQRSHAKAAVAVTVASSWPKGQLPPYPEDPLVKQYSAEYWLLGDLMTPPPLRKGSMATRVWNSSEADVVFVPFFATLSAELQLRKGRGRFRHQKENEDYERQKRVMDIVRSSPEWQRSGGRDHVFVLTDLE